MPIGLIIYLIVSSVLFVLAINLRLIPGNWFYEEFNETGNEFVVFVLSILWPYLLVMASWYVLALIVGLPAKIYLRHRNKQLDKISNEQIK
jgi:hypothetical protein